MSADIDIIYPIRQGNSNEELRYSLRSLSNLPHRNVILLGAPPAWTLCDTRPFPQGSNYRMNTTKAMKKACEDSSISNPFLYFNDDFFVMAPLLECPRLNRGPIDSVIAELSPKKDNYAQGMVSTKNLLLDLGFTSILSYELHMPLIVYKESMLYALKEYDKSRSSNLHKRTLYGNILDYGGESVSDNKIVHSRSDFDREFPFVSTSDKSFKEYPIGAWIRKFFPDPCNYER
jgi:hypothetical protein